MPFIRHREAGVCQAFHQQFNRQRRSTIIEDWVATLPTFVDLYMLTTNLMKLAADFIDEEAAAETSGVWATPRLRNQP